VRMGSCPDSRRYAGRPFADFLPHAVPKAKAVRRVKPPIICYKRPMRLHDYAPRPAHTSSGSSILTRPSAGRSCVTSPMKTPTRLRPSGPASQRKVRGPNSSPSNLRAAFGIPEPSEHLSEAISFIRQAIRAATSTCDQPTIDVLLNSCRKDRPSQYRLEALVRRVLRSTLEQLRSRQAK